MPAIKFQHALLSLATLGAACSPPATNLQHAETTTAVTITPTASGTVLARTRLGIYDMNLVETRLARQPSVTCFNMLVDEFSAAIDTSCVGGYNDNLNRTAEAHIVASTVIGQLNQTQVEIVPAIRKDVICALTYAQGAGNSGKLSCVKLG